MRGEERPKSRVGAMSGFGPSETLTFGQMSALRQYELHRQIASAPHRRAAICTDPHRNKGEIVRLQISSKGAVARSPQSLTPSEGP